MSKLRGLWREYKGLLAFIGLMMVFRSAIADWNYVPSSSMNPTLVAGDRVLVNKLAYNLRVPFTRIEVARWNTPQRGDVITFDSPADEVNLIKRVIAVGGDVVAMRDNQLTINGHPVARALIDAQRVIPSEMGDQRVEVWRESIGATRIDVARLPSRNRWTGFGPVQVPDGQMLVLGDSRDNSNDSRFIGFIDVRRVTGRAERVVLSHDPARFYMPRSTRWWLTLQVIDRG